MTPRPAERTTVRVLPRILAAALLAAACSDSVGPERAPAPPLFSFSAGGIALDQQNSAMGQPGRRFVKGFNPTNPQNGDAIVVTLFWVGQTNIVDSVTDHLVNNAFTKVGNTYNLVGYVTAGGISMATFVATSVQNIPLANPNGEDVLAIVADLHDSVPDGGLWMSSWRGVEDVYAQALGATHPSASGAGAAPTPAHPGTVTTVNSGALIYGVTMARPPAGVDPPAGFTRIAPFENIGDATLKADARYSVRASPGSVDPQWTWLFDQANPGTWLATGLVLNASTSTTNQYPVASFTSSCSGMTCSFSSTSTDPDGTIATYSWSFDDGAPMVTTPNATHTYGPSGTFIVSLTGRDNQGATNSIQHTVTVPGGANQPPVANFTSSCPTLTCSFTSTSSDPDGSIAGYSWSFGDGSPVVTTQNPSHTYGAGGTYTVTLTVTDNQGGTNSHSQGVTVTAGNQGPVAAFNQSCSGLDCTFTDRSTDPDGTLVAWNWTSSAGATSTEQNPPTSTYAQPGTYTVTLAVTDNVGATNSTQQNVTVGAANQPPVVGFTPSCSALTCTFTSTSSDPDGSIAGYSWNFGDGSPAVTTQNASHTYAAGGSYTVTLQVTDNQGATNSSSQSVTVTAANQPPLASFTNSCNGLTCTFTSTSSDPDGSIAGYSWNFGDGSPEVTTQNASHTYAAGGSYTVQLTVTDNQGAANSTSHTVGVTPPNQPPVASFTRSCNGLTCSLTSTSSDPDGTIASYSWNFGDGTPASTVQNPSHTYGAGGSYTVTLRVTDNQGAQSALASQTFTVTPPNQPPVASFTRSCNGLTCTFTSTSSDPDGTVAAYSWNFGDGTPISTLQNPSHTYAAGGSYTVTLQVTDNQGAQSAQPTNTLTVTPPNQPPVASFTKSCNGLTCSFTSTSSDPDGSIASYSWNFGDGTPVSTLQNPSHTYGAGGSYTVTLRVTDNQGAQSALASQTFTVTPPNQPPVASFTRSCNGLTCTFTSTSSDPDGTVAAYSWNFGDGSPVSTLQNPSHTYGAGGSYTVTLRVTDNQGAQSALASQTFKITPPNQPPVASFT